MADRSEGRTVFIYAKGDNTVLGGLVNTNGITNKNFYAMIEIILVFESSYTLALGGDDEDRPCTGTITIFA
ncbi:hypothetical protein MMC31_000099, partial [Peltigera leucophlebia]|nr:hypothetical protein [Peltigera leucophlebia]